MFIFNASIIVNNKTKELRRKSKTIAYESFNYYFIFKQNISIFIVF